MPDRTHWTPEQREREREQQRKRLAAMTPEKRDIYLANMRRYQRLRRVRCREEIREYDQRRYANRRADPVYVEKQRVRSRASWLRTTYGITVEGYDALFEKQGGVCAICGLAPDGGRPLDVDHCHGTGIVRGLLCNDCNLGIGRLRDDPTLVKRALIYLSHPRPKPNNGQ